MNELILKKLVLTEGPLTGQFVEGIESVTGGSIHKTWRLRLTNGQKVFAKTSKEEDIGMLEFEAQGLTKLKEFANSSFLEIPQPLAIKKLSGTAVLLLPWLSLNNGNQSSLGRGLALIHKNSAANNPGKFGWGTDGFIGAGPQPGGWRQSWGECFTSLRLLPQIKLAAKWGLEQSKNKLLLNKLIPFLDAHQPKPSLVHGDLWSGNASVTEKGLGILIDPACWWADREVDLAMTKLFGGFSADFYTSYEEIWPMDAFAKERTEIYNLYHLLNHANLFGGSYINQSHSTLKRLKWLVSQKDLSGL